MMKNRIKFTGFAGLLMVALAACSPQEFNDHSLGNPDTVSAGQISFSQTPSPTSANVITFTNTSDIKTTHALLWDLGNGVTGKNQSMTGQYPYAGDYTVSLTVYAPDGSSATRSEVIHIAGDDFGLINSPVYNRLTGGMDDADGVTWVIDQYNRFSQEVATATGKDIRGHIGLGPQGSASQEWWGAGPNEKNQWSLYAHTFTFIQAGTRLLIRNEGEGYGRNAAAANPGGFTVTSVDGDDATFGYSGGDYTFSIKEGSGNPVLTLSGNAFLGYYAGSQDYEIIYQTADAMALRVNNTVEGQDWVFVYCRQELNVSAPPVVKESKAIELSEDFEGEELSVAFLGEDMGSLTSFSYQNPAPVPVNESPTVSLYQKSTGFYSNLSFTAGDYLFDLTEVNKVRLKVFIPSYNDYVNDYDVAGDWISNRKLLPQLAVKLQNSSLGGNAWETQTEIVKANLEKDRWLELEFDFSSVASRTDYDRIVIQFGAEGHTAPGVFFFDDFSFNK
jgi:hypothetical protein